MKPKTIEETVKHIIYRAMNFNQDASSIMYDIDNLTADALAQIQQLLEECAPTDPTGSKHEIATWSDGVTEYKSNIRSKLK